MSRSHVIFIVALAAVFTVQLLLRPVVPIDETRYIGVAWEMHLSGDWAHLTRNFESYSHKPPLLFWLINLVWLGTGVAEFPARLVGPACALGVVALTGWLARRLWPGHPGLDLRAMSVVGGTTLFLVYGGATMFDAMLTLAVLPGILVIWTLGNGARGWRTWVMLGGCFALGTYAKGPVILVHLLPALVLMRLWAPVPLRAAEMAKGLAIALGVALAAVSVWLIPALVSGDAAFREELLVRQTVDRVAGGMRHDRPFWFLVVLLPVILFPFAWSWGVLRRLPDVAKADAGARLCVVWAVSTVAAFSLISGKQVHYLLPALPAFALLVARGTGTGRAWSFAWSVPLGLGGAAIAAAAGFLPREGIFDHAEPVWALALFGAALVLLAAAALRLPFWQGHAATGAGLALALHGLVALTSLQDEYDANRMAGVLAPHAAGGLAVWGMPYNAEWNFALRLTEPVATPATPDALAAWARNTPEGTVIAPLKSPPTETAPATTTSYAGRAFGLWPASALTSPGSDPSG